MRDYVFNHPGKHSNEASTSKSQVTDATDINVTMESALNQPGIFRMSCSELDISEDISLVQSIINEIINKTTMPQIEVVSVYCLNLQMKDYFRRQNQEKKS